MTTGRPATRLEKLTYGEDVTFDEHDQPIERGSGNMTDRENPKPAAEWPQNGTARAAVFGHKAAIDPVTGRPVESGISKNSAAIIAARNADDAK